jgi:hypothetical protein
MKDYNKQTPEKSCSGGTASTAYRKPNGDKPRIASSEMFKQFTICTAEAVGAENVTTITKPEELHQERYIEPSKTHDMYPIVDQEYFVGSAVIAPRGVPDVQAIMRLCVEFEIPVLAIFDLTECWM